MEGKDTPIQQGNQGRSFCEMFSCEKRAASLELRTIMKYQKTQQLNFCKAVKSVTDMFFTAFFCSSKIFGSLLLANLEDPLFEFNVGRVRLLIVIKAFFS